MPAKAELLQGPAASRFRLNHLALVPGPQEAGSPPKWPANTELIQSLALSGFRLRRVALVSGPQEATGSPKLPAKAELIQSPAPSGLRFNSPQRASGLFRCPLHSRAPLPDFQIPGRVPCLRLPHRFCRSGGADALSCWTPPSSSDDSHCKGCSSGSYGYPSGSDSFWLDPGGLHNRSDRGPLQSVPERSGAFHVSDVRLPDPRSSGSSGASVRVGALNSQRLRAAQSGLKYTLSSPLVIACLA